MSPETVSISTARNLMLAAQGLAQLPRRPAGKDDVLAAIRGMGLLQIDTINVVARSPYLVLWSRLGDYPPAWLDELLAERALFEYWSHAMCFLPIEDYPLYRRFMLDGGRGWGNAAEWVRKHTELVELRILHIAHPAPRGAGGAAGSKGPPRHRPVRGQSARPRAGRRAFRRPGRRAGLCPAPPGCLATAHPNWSSAAPSQRVWQTGCWPE